MAPKLLAEYSRKLAAYREASGGLPPDREAHLNAWAFARITVRDEEKSPNFGTFSRR